MFIESKLKYIFTSVDRIMELLLQYILQFSYIFLITNIYNNGNTTYHRLLNY